MLHACHTLLESSHGPPQHSVAWHAAPATRAIVVLSPPWTGCALCWLR